MTILVKLSEDQHPKPPFKSKSQCPWHWLSLLYTYPQPERWGPFMAEVYSRRKDMVISVSSRLP